VARRVALLGAHGHGASHLRNIARLATAGRVELVGVADPRPPDDDQRAQLPAGAAWIDDAESLVRTTRPDVTVVCTPIALHLRHALAAANTGSHVLLEKPPTSTLADFHVLIDAVQSRGVACQVGFQGFGSQALGVLVDAVRAGELGTVTSIGVLGEWVRPPGYFTRSAWAGRREVDGVPTLDGAVTNPFAHGLAAALAIDGSSGEADIVSVETSLFHANAMETDDTSTVRVLTRRGTVVTIGVTLCAPDPREPRLFVHGTQGHAELAYTEDSLSLTTGSASREVQAGRADLLENLLDHLDACGTPLLAPLREFGAFMAVVEEVRQAPPARLIPTRWVAEAADGSGALTVPGIQQALRRCIDDSRLLEEAGPEWAVRATPAQPPAVGHHP
jgi:predicted dehydrogenase